MKGSAALKKESREGDFWRGFRRGDWCTSINVRDFMRVEEHFGSAANDWTAFNNMVSSAHTNGIKVIVDFAPADLAAGRDTQIEAAAGVLFSR